MTTPTIELINKHGSVREYKPDPVSREVIETIVAAAQRTSTSSNLQIYSVVVVTDIEKRTRLQELCGDQAHIGQAPAFLTWCADLSRLERVCQLEGYTQEADHVENFLLAAVDASIAMQTAGLAAESLGLGFCFIGSIRNSLQEVIELLELPRLSFPLCGMTLGWPVSPPLVRPRLPLEAVLHWETYAVSGEERYLRQYDRAMIETGIYEGRQVSSADGEDDEENYGWMGHSARRVSQIIRPHLREVLRQAGFGLR